MQIRTRTHCCFILAAMLMWGCSKEYLADGPPEVNLVSGAYLVNAAGSDTILRMVAAYNALHQPTLITETHFVAGDTATYSGWHLQYISNRVARSVHVLKTYLPSVSTKVDSISHLYVSNELRRDSIRTYINGVFAQYALQYYFYPAPGRFLASTAEFDTTGSPFKIIQDYLNIEGTTGNYLTESDTSFVKTASDSAYRGLRASATFANNPNPLYGLYSYLPGENFERAEKRGLWGRGLGSQLLTTSRKEYLGWMAGAAPTVDSVITVFYNYHFNAKFNVDTAYIKKVPASGTDTVSTKLVLLYN